MNRIRFRRICAAVAGMLLCVLLAACHQDPELSATTDPTCATAQPPATSSSVTTTGQTTSTTAEPDTEPQMVANEQGKIARVTVSTPWQWNFFAEAFNADRSRFANSVEVSITDRLSFADMTFVALSDGFTGRICGEADDSLYDERKALLDAAMAQGETMTDLPASVGGFCDISVVFGSSSLFGDTVGSLYIENLDFTNISYANSDQENSGMLCGTVAILSLRDVAFSDCRFDAAEVTGVSHLLANTIKTLNIDHTVVLDCTAAAACEYGGLLFEHSENGGAVRNLSIAHSSFSVFNRETGCASLLGDRILQGIFQSVTLYDCGVSAPSTSALCARASAAALHDITVSRCSLRSFEYAAEPHLAGGILFGWNGEQEVFTSADVKNIVIADSTLSLEYRDFQWYESHGLTIENCRNQIEEQFRAHMTFPCETDENGLISAVTVATPQEWNDFAAAFNLGRGHFADSVDVAITAMLSFDGMTFTCLRAPFAGRIYGKAVEPSEGETPHALETDPPTVSYRTVTNGRYSVASGLTCGFTQIRAIDGYALFGYGRENGDVAIENLEFSEISYQLTNADTSYAMLLHSAKALTVSDVVLYRCKFGENGEQIPWPSTTPQCLFTVVSDSLSLSRVIVSDCDSFSFGNGHLLFGSAADAAFTQVYLLGCDVQSMFYGDYVEHASLFGELVCNTAEFTDIFLYDCHVSGSVASAFGHAGEVGAMKNIRIDRCSFTTAYEPHDATQSTLSGALFFSEKRTEFYGPIDTETAAIWATTEAELLIDAEIENVRVTNSVVMLPDGRELADYRAYGIIVENCLNIVD